MLLHRLLSVGVMLFGALAVAACGQASAGPPPAGAGATSPPSAPTAVGQASPGGGAVSSSGGASSGGSPGSAQGPGQSQPGPGADGAAPAGGGNAGGAAPAGPTTPYTDATYGFRVDHPADFVLRPRSAESLAQVAPAPVYGLAILSPARAASDLGELEAADLQIIIYPADSASSLESWLLDNGRLSEQASAPAFQTASASGLEVCGSTMIAPGCSYYFLAADRVYELTPASLEGEAMLQSFAPGS